MPPVLWAETSEEALREVAHSTEWVRLLHYDRKSATGDQSAAPTSGDFLGRADSPTFYLSPTGKSDPIAEVKAAIAAFKSSDSKWGAIAMSPACVFPARWSLLNARGLLKNVPRPDCPDFTEWRQHLNVDSATMVFASAYPNNPASMFGHTFLRLNHRRADHTHPGIELLDYAVSFLARVNPDDDPMSYTIKGIFGGYMGVFNVDPYYTMVTIYSGSERRDLWEYPLRLSAPEIERLVEHLWELQLTGGFTYFFFDENCSYQILALLEAAAPRLNLLTETGMMVLPHETLQTLARTELVKEDVVRRLSLESQLRHLKEQLTTPQLRQLTHFMTTDGELPNQLTPAVADTAIAYYNIRNYQAKNRLPPAERLRLNQLLSARAKMIGPATYAPPKVQSNPSGNPALGHGTHHWRAGAGVSAQDPFLSFSWKMGFHDFLNDDSGYESFGSINFLDLEARAYQSTKLPQAGHLGIAEVTSLRPFDPLLPELSWHMSLSNDPTLELDCRTCRKTTLRGGGGITLASDNRRWLSYVLVLAEGKVAGTYRDGIAAGPEGRFGIIFQDNPSHLKVLLEAQTHNDWTGNEPRQNYRKSRLEVAENATKDQDIRLSLQAIPAELDYPAWTEWMLSYGRAF